MRKKIIAGNWKMNKTPTQAHRFAKELSASIKSANVDTVLCVPFVSIPAVLDAVKGTDIAVGAQNLHFEESGAYTGEISASMLYDLGVKYVIIGHSERRQYFYETDELVNKKTLKALSAGLIPIVCVGETLTQREQGVTFDLIRMQTKIALKGVSETHAEKLVIAYEPVWAIGTGVTATDEQAQQACKAVRELLTELYGTQIAQKIRIQYGGSVKPKNARSLFEMPDIDGGLVGGASLEPDFLKIVDY